MDQERDQVRQEADLLGLLNEAIARELQVSIQYMFQHALGAARDTSLARPQVNAHMARFVGSHAPYILPGWTLKKIAIAEMRHAEAIAERVVHLGGEPTTQPDTVTIGSSIEEMLELDRGQELEAISLYGRIVGEARRLQDERTFRLFRRILTDERTHLRVLSSVLGVPSAQP